MYAKRQPECSHASPKIQQINAISADSNGRFDPAPIKAFVPTGYLITHVLKLLTLKGKRLGSRSPSDRTLITIARIQGVIPILSCVATNKIRRTRGHDGT